MSIETTKPIALQSAPDASKTYTDSFISQGVALVSNSINSGQKLELGVFMRLLSDAAATGTGQVEFTETYRDAQGELSGTVKRTFPRREIAMNQLAGALHAMCSAVNAIKPGQMSMSQGPLARVE